MSLLRLHLKGSTLIEVLISMVLISICFSIFLIVTYNVSRNGAKIRFKALLIQEQILAETKKNCDYIDKEYSYENITSKRQIIPYNYFNEKNLYVVIIRTFDNNGKLICSTKEVVKL